MSCQYGFVVGTSAKVDCWPGSGVDGLVGVATGVFVTVGGTGVVAGTVGVIPGAAPIRVIFTAVSVDKFETVKVS